MGSLYDAGQADTALAKAEANKALAQEQAEEFNVYNRAKAVLICSGVVESHGLKVFRAVDSGITVVENGKTVYHGFGKKITTTFHFGSWIFALDDMARAQKKKYQQAEAERARKFYQARTINRSFTPG